MAAASEDDRPVVQISGPAREQGRVSVGRSVAIIVALELGLVVAYLAVGAILDAAGWRPALSASLVIDVPAVIAFIVFIAVTRSWRRWGLVRPRGRWFTPGLLLGAVVVLFWVTGGGIREQSLDRYAYFVVLAAAVALFEEILFRGFILRLLQPFGIGVAVWGSAALFAVSHALNLFAGQDLLDTALQIAFALLIGVVFARLALRTGSIWIGVVAHALIDLPQYLNAHETPALVNAAIMALLIACVVLQARTSPTSGTPATATS